MNNQSRRKRYEHNGLSGRYPEPVADKLYEQIREEKKKEKLVFPHISKGYKPNREVLDMVADRLPVEIDVEAEQIKMWEERTK